ncbi:MAG TPA: DUF1722 domain-containing protein [Pseudomonadales bacterium]
MAEPGAARRDPGAGPERDGFPDRPRAPLPIAISQCLLGRAVRYDRSDAGFAFPHAALQGVFDFRGICPEVGIGLGTPRDPIRLVGDAADPRVLGVSDPSLDVTERLRDYATEQAATLDAVAGYVFMRGSPSCGVFDVKVHPVVEGAVADSFTRSGRGAFAAAVIGARPNLPVEENGRLHDPVLRENFVVRAFVYAHWRALERAGLTRGRLVEFHSRHKYLLMAHSVPHYRRAGRLLAEQGALEQRAGAYAELLMAGLSRPPGRRGHVNVLFHLQGYFKRRLDRSGRGVLDRLIHAYRRGDVSVTEPIGQIRELLRQHPDPYLERQAYLDLYASEP